MLVAPLLDAACVLVFVLMGRRTHDEGTGITAVIEVAAPFLIALAVAWIVLRAWRAPLSPPTGVNLAVVTVVIGQALRRFVFDRGTAFTFIVVSTAFITAAFVVWRLLAARIAPRFVRERAD